MAGFESLGCEGLAWSCNGHLVAWGSENVSAGKVCWGIAFLNLEEVLGNLCRNNQIEEWVARVERRVKTALRLGSKKEACRSHVTR